MSVFLNFNGKPFDFGDIFKYKIFKFYMFEYIIDRFLCNSHYIETSQYRNFEIIIQNRKF